MNVMVRRTLVAALLSLFLNGGLQAQAVQRIGIDANAATTPFPHFWEQTFGSGRAILSLRESYRNDLRQVKQITNFDSVRFHGILMDDVGLYDPDRRAQNPGLAAQADNDASVYNFSYIDQIYDGLLANGVRPFVELSFMPKKMASDPAALHAFWYKQNVSPPKDYKLWDAMMTAFAQHLIARYGIEEVSHWSFEVWNEPNIDFWAGNPKQPTYFELYDHTARALKAASPRIRVGGPSTAQAAWVGEFLAHCKQNNVPVDFASTHVYANDTAQDVFHTQEVIPRDKMVCRAVRKVHDEIARSPFPATPLIFSEYNASYANEPNITDSVYMGPWLATTISQCDGLVENMSYWSFSDVFEEQGVVRTPFYGGFGLIAEDSIPKPTFNIFALLHQLGERRLKLNSDSALATKTADGSLVVALWNYAPPTGTGANYTPPPTRPGPGKTMEVTFAGEAKNAAVTLYRVDSTHGNVMRAFDAMGRPPTPSRVQIRELQKAGAAASPEHVSLANGTLTVTIPAQGLVLLKLEHVRK
ncbi:MAG: glycosyl hydrolase family 39 [Acidobacteriaceae bacterium]